MQWRGTWLHRRWVTAVGVALGLVMAAGGPAGAATAPAGWEPLAVAIGPDGAAYVTDCGAARIYRMTGSGNVEVFCTS